MIKRVRVFSRELISTIQPAATKRHTNQVAPQNDSQTFFLQARRKIRHRQYTQYVVHDVTALKFERAIAPQAIYAGNNPLGCTINTVFYCILQRYGAVRMQRHNCRKWLQKCCLNLQKPVIIWQPTAAWQRLPGHGNRNMAT